MTSNLTWMALQGTPTWDFGKQTVGKHHRPTTGFYPRGHLEALANQIGKLGIHHTQV